MYKRLHVQSVLGVPYRNCGSGLMVVRNPKRFKNCYTGLNIIAYIVTNEIMLIGNIFSFYWCGVKNDRMSGIIYTKDNVILYRMES